MLMQQRRKKLLRATQQVLALSLRESDISEPSANVSTSPWPHVLTRLLLAASRVLASEGGEARGCEGVKGKRKEGRECWGREGRRGEVRGCGGLEGGEGVMWKRRRP